MAKTWADVAASSAFQSLSAAEQDEARQQYFEQVVAPQVPDEDLDLVRSQFDKDTRIAKRDLPADIQPSTAGGGRGSINPPLAAERQPELAKQPGLIERAASALSSVLPKPVDPLGIASGKPLGNTPIRAEEPVKERKAPTPYRDRREALDDAVNLLEEGVDQADVTEVFGKVGIKFDEIADHGKKRNSEYFKQQPGMEVSDPEVTRLAKRAPAPVTGEIKAYETSVGEDIANFAKRVAGRSSQAFTGLLANTGVLDEDQAAAALARDERRIQAARPPESIQAGFEEIGQAKTYGDAVTALARNPGATATMLAESVLMTAPVLAASAARLPAVGLAAATGGFSASLEYGGAMADVLSERRIDMLDANKLASALKDPEIIAEIRDKGVKRGLTIGIIDGLTAGIAGKFLEPVQKTIASGKLASDAARRATVGAWAKELGVQVAGGSGGEFAAQQLTGENKPADVLLEGLGEGVSAPFEARSNLAASRKLDPLQQIAQEIESTNIDVAGGVDGRVRTLLNPNAYDATLISPEQTTRRADDVGPSAPVQTQDAYAPADPQRARLFELETVARGGTSYTYPTASGESVTVEIPKGRTLSEQERTELGDLRVERAQPISFTPANSPSAQAGLAPIVVPIPTASETTDVSTTGGTGAAPAVGGLAAGNQLGGSLGIPGLDAAGAGQLGGRDAGLSAANAGADVPARGAGGQPTPSLTLPRVAPRANDQDLLARTEAAIASQESNNAVGQPIEQWVGRKGGGYETEADAKQALPGRQRMFPALDWTVEQMPGGKFRLAGYGQQSSQAAPSVGATQEGAGGSQPTQSAPAAEPITAPGGKPFSTEKTAAVYAQQNGITGYSTVKMDGGWAIKPTETTLGTQTPQAIQGQTQGQQASAVGGAAGAGVLQPLASGSAAQAQGGGDIGLGSVATGPKAQAQRPGALGTPEGAATAGLKTSLRLAPPAPLRAVGKALTALKTSLGVDAEIDNSPLTESQQAASAIARLNGRTITMLKAETPGSLPNGFMIPGDSKNIYIANDSDDAPLSVAMHEIYHTLPEAQRKALNTQLLQYFKEDKRGEFATQFSYDPKNDAMLDEEIPAFMVQAISKREDFWQDLRTKMGNAEFGEVAKVILSKLNSIISGAKKEYGDEFVNKYITDVAKARDLLSTAYAESMKAQGFTPDIALVSDAQPMASNRAAPQTPEFKKFFGNSKVVDADGKPRVMYHGTDADIATFEPKNGMIFVTADPKFAEEYTTTTIDSLDKSGGQPNIIPVYVKAENPFDYENPEHIAALEQYEKDNRYTERSVSNYVRDIKRGDYEAIESRKVQAAIKAMGHDGFYVREAGRQVKNLGVFRPEQIKSATGNNGQFDASNPDIRRSNRAVDFTDPESRLSVSTAQPWAKADRKTGYKPDSYTEKRVIDAEDIKASETHVKAIHDALRKYNTLSGKGAPAKVMQELHDVVVDNLLWLHDHVDPEVRERAKLWYDGANRIATDWTKKFDTNLRQTGGILAVFSPQMDWFKNVSLAERALIVLTRHADETWSKGMTQWAESWLNASPDVATKRSREGDVANMRRIAADGKKLKDLSKEDAAYFIRAFDEAYFSRNYRLVTPEGGFDGFVVNDDGQTLASVTWGGFGTIEKAVSIFRDGSFRNVDQQLGGEHKVRNFYNNIVDPNSADGHVTIDTHAVAAALVKPLSGASIEVAHNLGGLGSTAATGASGSYALYADAYRDAAKQRGLLAREMQSITWEAVRALFPASLKSGLSEKISKIWDRVKAGEITREEARKEIVDVAGGVRAFAWEGGGKGEFASDGATSFETAVAEDPAKREVRTMEPKTAKDKMQISLSAATLTIPGIRKLYELAQGKDTAAHALLQNIAYDSLAHLLSGTSASIQMQPATGLYGGASEPSLALNVSFADHNRDIVLAALEKFAQNFNQEQIHVRQGTKDKAGKKYDDGSYATPTYRWELKQSLDRKQIQKIIDQSGLYGLTFGDSFVEAYFVGDVHDEEQFKQFETAIERASGLLGKSSASAGRSVTRLWPYGHGDGAIGYDRIRGDIATREALTSSTAKRVAEYLKGAKVKVFEQAPEITEKQAALQGNIAEVYESLPDNDLKNPRVRKAYGELAKEVVRQFEALPVKVEVMTGQGEPYKSSADMRRDILDNNHLYIFGTTPETFGPAGEDFTGHPLLEDTGLKDQNGHPLLANDLLRAVHDYYAHAMSPTQFGPKGEEAAWKNHMSMTNSPWARWALTSETRGQNSWVNFRDEVKDTPIKEREFARQKAVLLPIEFAMTGDKTVDAPMRELEKSLPETARAGSKPAKVMTSNRVLEDRSGLSRLSYQGYVKAEVPRVQAARKMAGILAKLDAGTITPQEFELQVRLLSERLAEVSATKDANRIVSERARGADIVREKLIAARRRGEVDSDTTEFALWALQQNPAMAEGLGISVREQPENQRGAAGDYNPAAAIMRVFKGASKATTAVHEILHHTERMMPEAVQTGIRKEWSKAYAKALNSANPAQREALEKMLAAMAGDPKAQTAVRAAFNDGTLDADVHYQLVNPSEFWAVNATDILQRRYEAGSWIGKAKQWLSEMVQKAKGLVGMRSNAPVLRGLEAVLNSDGERQSKKMLSEGKVFEDISAPDTKNFKRWAKDLPIVEDGGNDYEGGAAVFVAYHGTTHDDITEFKTVGNKEGALGQGPYMSTSVADVNENYAGVGPDLTNRIGREEDSVRDSFYDDPWSATQVLEDYFAAENIDIEVTDDNFDELKDEYGDKAITHAATARLKGKSDGLVMPVYVRMEKPFNMASNPTYFELTYPQDENGEPDYEAEPEGTAIDLINAIEKVAGWYDADASDLTGWVYENATDGVSAREVFDRAAKDMSELYDDGGEMISSGQFIQEVARELGFDGLIQDADLYFGTQRKGFGGIRAGAMKGVNPSTLHLMPFDGKQVKSATGNSGEFDPGNPDIRASNRRQKLIGSNFELPATGKVDAARIKLQDDGLRMKRVIDAVKNNGGTVGEAQNFYDANTLMPGRVQAAMDDFRDNVMRPLIDKAVKFGIDLDELALYAYAKHAEERNAYIASINKRMPDGGSGMTDAHAKSILQLANASGDEAKFEELHQDLMAITSTTRQVMLSEGLITQDEFDALDGAYENYIPLRGLENVDENTGAMRPGIGRGINVRGGETIRAMGRKSQASDLIENVIRDYQRVIMRVEKNDVGKVLLDFVLSNPDPDLWGVDVERNKPAFNKATGTVQYTKSIEKGEDTIGVKVGGQQVYIKLADPELARAIRQAWKEETSGLERATLAVSGWWNNWLRNVLTRYNPAFAAINIPRDALWSGTAAALAELGPKGLIKYLANYGKALMASTRQEAGVGGTANKLIGNQQMDQQFQEFRNAGSITGGFYMRSLDDINKDLRNEMLLAGAKSKNTFEAIKSLPPYKLATLTGRMLEFMGAASENATRFALYQAAREVGKTPTQAALLAKDGTTNFNRKGEWGGALNNMYLFFNAGVQGTAQLVKVLKNPAVQASMAGVTGVGVMLALYGASAGGADDDGEAYWDKVPSYVKERNLVFMLPPGDALADGIERAGKRGRYFTIPVQYGFNIFPNAGYVMADVWRNAQDPKRGMTPTKAALHMASTVFGSINPFGGAVDFKDGVQVLLAAMPTLVDLPVQLINERGTFGTPSAPERSPFDTRPDSSRMFVSQMNTLPEKIAKALNELGGGNEAKPGNIMGVETSVTPGTIQTLISATTGGLGSFVEQVGSSVVAMTGDDKDLKAAKIPFLNKFYGEVDESANIRTAGDRMREIKKLSDQVKAQQKVGLDPELDSDEERLLGLAKMQEAYQKQQSVMRKAEIAIIKDKDMTEAEKKLQRRQLQVERDRLATDVNREYLKSMK